VPESVRTRLFRSRNGYSAADIPRPVVAPEATTRLLVGPANSAGQGWAWARAAERLDGVRAVDLQVRGAGDFGYPADYSVPSGVAAHSPRWGRGQWDAVSRGFTHVLAESQLPLFGGRFQGDVVAEHRALAAAGLAVASVCHGSDIRSPARHREHESWSPFHDENLELTRSLVSSVARRQAILDELDGVEFVSTPDLLLDRPRASWLPVVVDAGRWATDQPPLERDLVVVFHAPSHAGLKGTALIMPDLRRAAAAREIDLRAPDRVPMSSMPALVSEADVVLDQFALGIYGVAAAEAMAAGRLVVSHVTDFVRETVRAETGRELPIVEATPDTLLDVLADIRDRREHYRAIAARGPDFVAAVHDGRRSAAVLAPFLRSSQPTLARII
jgi:hypothetical protein